MSGQFLYAKKSKHEKGMVCENVTVKHLLTRWNPYGDPSEHFERRTIEVHCEILANYSGADQYVWYGKISKTNVLGIKDEDIEAINRQIASGVETHFYMYCPPDSLLHAGKLEAISKENKRGDPHTPSYYSLVPYSIPLWFKLSDIKKMDKERCFTSILREENGAIFDSVSGHFPRVVIETPAQTLFNYSSTGGRKWFPRSGQGALIPRCFKTGGQLCINPEARQTESEQRVFIGMPFRPKYEDLYKFAIKPVLDELGLEAWKANEEIQNVDLMCKVCAGIQISGSAIMEISDWNPNVMFELGLIYGLGKEAFIIKAKKAKIPVDLHGMILIIYVDFDDLGRKLEKYLAKLSRGS